MAGIGNYRHGWRRDGTSDITYEAWKRMSGRCYNAKNAKYHRYGGRGITVCHRWRGQRGFINFLSDLGEKPKGSTLGRINNDGDYTPRNCRWESQTQQAHNRVTTRLTATQAVAIYKLKPKQKRTQTAAILASQLNVSRHTIYKIWDRSNWAEATRDS